MDPVTALGVAAAAMQFVSFASDFVDGVISLHNSEEGQEARNADIANNAQHIEDILQGLRWTPSTYRSTPAADVLEAKLTIVISECHAVHKELDALLRTTQVTESKNGRAIEIIRVTWRSTRKKHEIDRLYEKLRHLRDHTNSCVMMLLGSKNEDLTKAICNLAKETQSAAMKSTLELTKLRRTITDGLESTHDVSKATHTLIDELAKETRVRRRLSTFLQSLRFEEINSRLDSIVEAESYTFEWLFGVDPSDSSPDIKEASCQKAPHVSPDEETKVRSRSGFESWLSSDHSLYWITGVPGCGKSTLTKYIGTHKKTTEKLQLWAGPDAEVIVASCYFWNAGSDLQKSHQGLLRTLLEQITLAIPHHVADACHDRFYDLAETGPAPWTTVELTLVLNSVIERTAEKDLNIRFCFFIDGLDEYIGDHNVIAKFMKDLSQKPHIKSDQLMDMVHQICTRSQGVFLWVNLVCQDILQGYVNGDSWDELMALVDSTPDGLEPYFEKMLSNIDPKYAAETATILLACLGNNGRYDRARLVDAKVGKVQWTGGTTEAWGTLHAAMAEPISPEQIRAYCGNIIDVGEVSVGFIHRTAHDFVSGRASMLASVLQRNDLNLLLYDYRTEIYKLGFNNHFDLFFLDGSFMTLSEYENATGRTDAVFLDGLDEYLHGLYVQNCLWEYGDTLIRSLHRGTTIYTATTLANSPDIHFEPTTGMNGIWLHHLYNELPHFASGINGTVKRVPDGFKYLIENSSCCDHFFDERTDLSMEPVLRRVQKKRRCRILLGLLPGPSSLAAHWHCYIRGWLFILYMSIIGKEDFNIEPRALMTKSLPPGTHRRKRKKPSPTTPYYHGEILEWGDFLPLELYDFCDIMWPCTWLAMSIAMSIAVTTVISSVLMAVNSARFSGHLNWIQISHKTAVALKVVAKDMKKAYALSSLLDKLHFDKIMDRENTIEIAEKHTLE
ncbi:small s protein [Ophiostoma piceae UAMH 11346]|uniref:Small s protein n=1 Tax=Ophiostoma piceae (strain UAMH 11346) TaxID=1262450 RepID=S3CS87_OPHP1|nr:small s protein [Ophiostoma piceae UAMH 11346]